MKLDVHVDFRGGWLTEFYPNAKADAPGLKQGDFRFLTKAVSTSSRRFQQGAFFWTFTKWVVFQSLYWIGVPARILVKIYETFK